MLNSLLYFLLLISSAAASLVSQNATLHLLTAYPEALCLDGTPGGYYYRPAPSGGIPASTKWKVHLQGGGWCTSTDECKLRAQTVLGSSKTWPTDLSQFWPPEGAKYSGLMNGTALNPFGPAYHFVWFGYCDGSSFSGNQSPSSSAPLYFKGQDILEAIITDLNLRYNFTSMATDVIVSGTSAGGLATYLHSSYFKERMPGARVVAVPDAGFFLDHAVYGSTEHKWYQTISYASSPALWNSSLRGKGPRLCVETIGIAKCMFPQYMYPFLSDVDGIFTLQSSYDTAQQAIIFQLPCDYAQPGGCSAEEQDAFTRYAETLRSTVAQTVQQWFSQRDGYFLTSCYQHEESCTWRDWFGIRIEGMSANDTLYRWWVESGPKGNDTRRVDVLWPRDGSCAPQGFVHGAC